MNTWCEEKVAQTQRKAIGTSGMSSRSPCCTRPQEKDYQEIEVADTDPLSIVGFQIILNFFLFQGYFLNRP
jgi:hypothetical protein